MGRILDQLMGINLHLNLTISKKTWKIITDFSELSLLAVYLFLLLNLEYSFRNVININIVKILSCEEYS